MERYPVQELRWDPILGEWVLVSNIREARPWQPQSFCPFCPGAPETGYGWDILILENRYPMLSTHQYRLERHWFYRKAQPYGKNYVVVETPEHDLDDISDLPEEHIYRVLRAVRERFIEDSRDHRFAYFLYFRNKGREIGVSLTHPHSQIYVLPFIPAKVRRELTNASRYYRRSGRCLFCKILEVEEEDRVRIIYRGRKWIAFIPFYAHWPFEIHIYPRKHIQTLRALEDDLAQDLAPALRKILGGLKRLFDKPMPYIMVLHQAPMHGNHSYYHLHVEIYGMYRTSGKLKYAAGMETGGGNFTYDDTPESAAEMLRKAVDKLS